MLYFSGTIIAFFLAFLLVTKRNKTHGDHILGAWLTVLGFHLLAFYITFTSQQYNFPSLVVLGIPLPLVHGPFLYLYTHQQTSSHPFHKKQLLHFVPLLLSYGMFLDFFLLSADQKAEVFRQEGRGYETRLVINHMAIYASGIVYVALSLLRLMRYRRRMVQVFSNTEKINFNWLLYLILWIVFIWIFVLFVQEDKLIFGAASLFVLWLGYFGIKQVQVFTQVRPYQPNGLPVNDTDYIESESMDPIEDENPLVNENSAESKYQKSTLSEEEAALIHDRLRQLMAEQKPYKNPDLTLNQLAKTLDVHPNNLSQVINSKEKKNFYDLVNEKRVDAFIKNIKQPVSQQYTLLAIAYDCGFNSKASFNRNFKKYTGYTPSDYLKLQHAS